MWRRASACRIVSGERPADRAATLAATGASLAMVSFQLAGKATRDAFYLSTFSVATLPRIMIASAVVSAIATIALSRVMARIGPARLVPPLFITSAILLLGEWALSGPARPVAAVLLYLHFGGLGALLVSGFWAVVTERFDPRTARATVGRIGAGGSIGGLLGGVLPTVVGSHVPITAMLPVLAGLHFASAALVLRVPLQSGPENGAPGPAPQKERHRSAGAREAISPGDVFRASGYLRGLVLLVILTGAAEGLLDFVFKVRVTEATRGGEGLLHLFAEFYLITALVSLVIQAALLRRTLSWLGTSGTAATLPAGVTAGAVAGLLMPGLGPMIAARGTEIVLRNSIFRGAYELLFTPITSPEKRAVKLLVDVGATRLGDILSAALIEGAVFLSLGAGRRVLLGATLALAFLALLVARRIHLAYTDALARNLAFRTEQLEAPLETSTLLHSVTGFDLRELRPQEEAVMVLAAPPLTRAPLPEPTRLGPADGAGGEGGRVEERLGSPDPDVVRAALLAGPLAPELADRAVSLLAWDAVAPAAAEALTTLDVAHAPTLARRLVDPEEDFTVRRRLVRVLVGIPVPAVLQALVGALSDPRFEVRYQAGRALSHLRGRGEWQGSGLDQAAVLELVLKEVMVERNLWESRELIDATDDGWAPLEAHLIRSRADRSLEHVFTLLTLILPREPLRLAWQALQTEDRQLRGTALEYLESVLPPKVQEQLWRFLEPEVVRRPAEIRPREEVLDNLLKSRVSIVLAVEALRRLQTRTAANAFFEPDP
jgi:ATP:ADP antiporter, AAA family